jgi:hypothetical protein
MTLRTAATLRLIFGLLFAGVILGWAYFVTQQRNPFAKDEAEESGAKG